PLPVEEGHKLTDALDLPVLSSQGRGARAGGPGGLRAVGQRLAAQSGGDAGGFADRGHRGLGPPAGGQGGGAGGEPVGPARRGGGRWGAWWRSAWGRWEGVRWRRNPATAAVNAAPSASGSAAARRARARSRSARSIGASYPGW